jgi:uncharacterized membrane protein YdcZ (DUF606 family)
MEAFAIPFLLAVGGLLAVQAAANVQLSAAVGSAVGGATVQLAIGAALLAVAAAAAGALAALHLIARAPGWHLVGGVASAVYICGGIVLFPRLGAIVTVGLFIAGQMLASFVLDATGWLGVEQRAADAAAALGIVAVLAGAATIVRAQTGAPARARAQWVAFALLAGAVLPVQGAINAQLRADLDAPMAAALWSFGVATAAMGAVFAGFPGRRTCTGAARARARRRAVVGLARRPVRRDLRDLRVPAHPAHRRRADGRPHRRRPADRVDLRRSPWLAAPAAPGDLAGAPGRCGRAARRRRAHPARVITPARCSG